MSNPLSFLLLRFLFEAQTLLSNMAANWNGQIEGWRKSFPSSPAKKHILLSWRLNCLLYSNIMYHMFFPQILANKLLVTNVSFYVSSHHVTVKQSVIIGRNLPGNLIVFLVKISSYTNKCDSVENKKGTRFSCMA